MKGIQEFRFYRSWLNIAIKLPSRWLLQRKRHEASPQATSVSGRWRCRTSSLRADRNGASLSIAAGENNRRLSGRRPGYDASGWYGIGAPKGTPFEVIDRLNSQINAGLADPKMKIRVAEMGETTISTSPADFGKLIAEETEKWGKLIRAANIKGE